MEQEEADGKGMPIVVSKNGPYIVTGGGPPIQQEICNDDEAY